MGVLSRWSGGVLDRFGARWPLMVGPTVAALGFGLLALPVGGESYWAFLGPIAILGLGMVVSVAPLTTTVINAVPTHQTGVASGINNAVASVANLLAIAVLGALALGTYNQALDNHLKSRSCPAPWYGPCRAPRVNSSPPRHCQWFRATIERSRRRSSRSRWRAAYGSSCWLPPRLP
jgi:MFS family permease